MCLISIFFHWTWESNSRKMYMKCVTYKWCARILDYEIYSKIDDASNIKKFHVNLQYNKSKLRETLNHTWKIEKYNLKKFNRIPCNFEKFQVISIDTFLLFLSLIISISPPVLFYFYCIGKFTLSFLRYLIGPNCQHELVHFERILFLIKFNYNCGLHLSFSIHIFQLNVWTVNIFGIYLIFWIKHTISFAYTQFQS